MNMKRIGLWATGIGVLISVGLLTAEQGYTEEKETQATLPANLMMVAEKITAA
jgi:hypothetical protein